ncbi:hypothetical protein [Pontibacter roseus]|uniref:hypothetical protein n=1 Tax=Pontibacter roseus TaxID=336989 RepID=UPI000382435F|nr:hypothetical protein [Pontibacter roseus]
MYQTSTLENKKQVFVTPEGVVKWLGVVVFILLLANITGIVLENIVQSEARFTRILVRYFDFNGESNIPAFFSSIILLLSAAILFLIYKQRRHQGKTRYTRQWLLLGLLFVFLAVDENVQLHEHVAEFVRPQLGNDLSGFLHWAWVVPYAVLTVAVMFYFLRFVLHLPPFTRRLVFIAGALFVTGALGLELFEGYLYKRYGIDHLYNRILYCLEELMEMSGVVLFIYALLHYLAQRDTQVALVPKENAALQPK